MFPRRSTFPPRDLFNFYFATHIDVARVRGQPRMDTNEHEHCRASLPDADGSVLTTDYTNRTIGERTRLACWFRRPRRNNPITHEGHESSWRCFESGTEETR